jgi:hypothetical protein
MRLPQIKASLGSLLELAWYAICAVEADPEVANTEKALLAARQALKKLRDARNDAADDLVKARALHGMALLAVAKWLRQLGLDATAAFGGKKNSLDFKRIFPMAPSKMMGQAAAERVASMQQVLKALAHPATPKSLTPAIKSGEALLKVLEAKKAGVSAAQSVEKDRVDDIRVARVTWFNAYKSLEAALTLKFPDDRQRVDAYFDDPPKAKGDASAAEPGAAVPAAVQP